MPRPSRPILPTDTNGSRETNTATPPPELVQCEQCDHFVPAQNMELHLLRACRGSRSDPIPLTTPSPSREASRSTEEMVFERSGSNWGEDEESTCIEAVLMEPSASDQNSGDDVQVSECIDLVDDDEGTEHTAEEASNQDDEQWACPRCTLLNPRDYLQCDACHYQRQETRPADPVLHHNRLVVDGMPVPIVRGRSVVAGSTSTSGGAMVGGGALLGALLGGTSARLRGQSFASGALSGALGGAVGGVIVGDVMRDSPSAGSQQCPDQRLSSSNTVHNPYSERRRSPRISSTNGTQTDDTNSMTSPSEASTANGFQYVRIRRSGPDGRSVTVLGNPNPDPMIQMLLQSMLAGGGRPLPGAASTGTDNMSYEQLLDIFGDGSDHRGAEEHVIQSLPSNVLSSVNDLPDDSKKCNICLEDFVEGEKVRRLPCLHAFHEECVDRWLRHNASCPVCKHGIQ